MVSTFVSHDDRFKAILGPNPTLELLHEDDRYPFAHEAGVYFDDRNELWITSNRFWDPDTSQPSQPRVQISRVRFGARDTVRSPSNTKREEVDSSCVPMGNGGVNYGPDKILFCAQGSHDLPSGLYAMDAHHPYSVSLILADFYGRPFNSVNDVIFHSDGSIWFTDPPYGHEQGYRPLPCLPAHVYRYNPVTNGVRAMADGLGHPNGLCFSPDEKTVYVTDTDWLHGSGTTNDAKASTM